MKLFRLHSLLIIAAVLLLSNSIAYALTVNTDQIADGAVTDVKITGPISASKISPAGLDADTVDGKHASDFAPSVHSHSLLPDNVKTVQKGAVDNSSTFNTVTDALFSITDASETNPYAVVVMPGVYEENIVGKSYVDIIGKSRTGTIIKTAGSIGYAVTMAPFSAVTNVTIDASGYGNRGVKITGSNEGIFACNLKLASEGQVAIFLTSSSGSVIIDDVSIEGSPGNIGTGIYLDNATGPLMINKVDMKIFGNGIQGYYAGSVPAEIHNVTVFKTGPSASGLYLYRGTYNVQNASLESLFLYYSDGVNPPATVHCDNCVLKNGIYTVGTAIMNNSSITGTVSVGNDVTGVKGSVRIGNSKVAGQITPSGIGNIKIINCYDGNYDAIPNGVY